MLLNLKNNNQKNFNWMLMHSFHNIFLLSVKHLLGGGTPNAKYYMSFCVLTDKEKNLLQKKKLANKTLWARWRYTIYQFFDRSTNHLRRLLLETPLDWNKAYLLVDMGDKPQIVTVPQSFSPTLPEIKIKYNIYETYVLPVTFWLLILKLTDAFTFRVCLFSTSRYYLLVNFVITNTKI